jgi:hypothetical protein
MPLLIKRRGKSSNQNSDIVVEEREERYKMGYF